MHLAPQVSVTGTLSNFLAPTSLPKLPAYNKAYTEVKSTQDHFLYNQ